MHSLDWGPTVWGPTVWGLQSWSLQSGSLQSGATDFGTGDALIGLTGGLQSRGLQPHATNFEAVDVLTALGAFTLGAYSLVLPMFDPGNHSTVPEERYTGCFNHLVVQGNVYGPRLMRDVRFSG